MKTRITHLHVDVVQKLVGVRFSVLSESGEIERSGRHILAYKNSPPTLEEAQSALDSDVDSLTVDIKPEALTTALMRLSSLRRAAEEVANDLRQKQEAARATVSAAEVRISTLAKEEEVLRTKISEAKNGSS